MSTFRTWVKYIHNSNPFFTVLTVRGGIFKFVFLVFGGFFWFFLEGGFFVQGLGGLVFCFVLFFWVLVWFGLVWWVFLSGTFVNKINKIPESARRSIWIPCCPNLDARGSVGLHRAVPDSNCIPELAFSNQTFASNHSCQAVIKTEE